MAYFYTKLSFFILIGCILFYFYYRYNHTKKVIQMEARVNSAYEDHKLLLIAFFACLVITILIYKIEHRVYLHTSIINEYKQMRTYLNELHKRKTPPSPNDGLPFTKLRQLQYFTDNEAIRRSIKNGDYDITAQILQEKMEETYPNMVRQILCNNADACIMAISGKPIIGLAKIMKDK